VHAGIAAKCGNTGLSPWLRDALNRNGDPRFGTAAAASHNCPSWNPNGYEIVATISHKPCERRQCRAPMQRNQKLQDFSAGIAAAAVTIDRL